MNTGRKYVLVTGASEGIGNSTVHALLRGYPGINVIGVARREMADMVGFEELVQPTSDEGIFRANDRGRRYHHLRCDLKTERERQEIIETVKTLIGDTGKLISVALVCGPGYLKGQIEEAQQQGRNLLDEMRILNREAPMDLVDELVNNGELMDSNGTVIHVGGLFQHPTIRELGEPGVEDFAKIKEAATVAIRRKVVDESALSENGYVQVMPAHYPTKMWTDAATRTDAPLAWFSGPPGNLRALGECLAERAVTPNRKGTHEIVRPRYIARLVERGPDAMRESFAGAIKIFAPAVLNMLGQDPEDHQKRVDHHRKRGTYGPGDDSFYDEIAADRLRTKLLSRLAFAGMDLTGQTK